MEQLKEQSTDKEYGVTTKTVGFYQNYSFLLPTLEVLLEQRKRLKISLNKMSKDLYGNRNYVNYLSKIEKGEIPHVSYEVIARMHIYLGEIEYSKQKESKTTLEKQISDIYKLAHKKNYDDFCKYMKEFNLLNYQI
jgi:hypothetical protein